MRIVEAIVTMSLDDVRAEAVALMPFAIHVSESRVEIDPVHGTLRGPRIQKHTCGAQLQNWHEGFMREWCEQQVSSDLFPTRCSYLYYDRNSILGLHHDSPSCTYTAVVNLLGEPPILRILLDEFDLQIDALLAASQRGHGQIKQGVEIALHSDRPLLFRGFRYPHQLQPFRSQCTLAAFCYATLKPPGDPDE